jgi:hypothetical protein
MKNKAATFCRKVGNYLLTLRQIPEEEIRGLDGKYLAIFNISKIIRVALL